MPSEFSRNSLIKGVVRTAALIAVLILIVLLAPGLGEVRDLLDEATPAGSRSRSPSRRSRSAPTSSCSRRSSAAG